MDKNRILIALSESAQTKFGKANFETQSIPQKVFSAIWSLESEVNNGGFLQYFQNSSAETAPFVVQALEILGAPGAAATCRRAIRSAFPQGLPGTPEAISAAANSLNDKTCDMLDALDQEFMAYPDDLTELLFEYVSVHRDEFGELPVQ